MLRSVSGAVGSGVGSALGAGRWSELGGRVTSQLRRGEAGRLFAVVQLGGRRRKVTAGDLLVLEGYQSAAVGEEVRLSKVAMVGARDWSLFGTPLVPAAAADVRATLVEKTFSATLPRRFFIRTKTRMGYTNYTRTPQTFLRVTSVRVDPDALLAHADPSPSPQPQPTDPGVEQRQSPS